MDTISLTRRFNAAMLALEAASRGLSARERLIVQIRASEINGCRFCLDMHTKEAREKGVDVTPANEREEVIARVTDAGTRLSDASSVDPVIDEALEVLGEKTTADLIAAVATINAWNRVGRLSRK